MARLKAFAKSTEIIMPYQVWRWFRMSHTACMYALRF
jgi:hypothetical protein